MKTRPYFLFLPVLLVLSFVFNGCDGDSICERGKGSTVTQSVIIPEFTGFDLKIAGDVFITQGDSQAVEVTGQENLIDLLDTDVDNNGVWDIRFTECVRNINDFEVHITLPEIDFMKVSGSGDITGQNLLEVTNLELTISGSGNVKADVKGQTISTKISGSGDLEMGIEATSLNTQISGSGNIEHTGTVDDWDIQISGSGDIFAFGLITQETRIRINGSGNAEIYAEQLLNVDISGSGDVRYKGNPALNVDISGSGKVINAN